MSRGARESLSPLPVQIVRDLAVAQQRARPGLDSLRPVRTAGARPLGQHCQRLVARLRITVTSSCLDQLDQRPAEDARVFVPASTLGGCQPGLVACYPPLSFCSFLLNLSTPPQRIGAALGRADRRYSWRTTCGTEPNVFTFVLTILC